MHLLMAITSDHRPDHIPLTTSTDATPLEALAHLWNDYHSLTDEEWALVRKKIKPLFESQGIFTWYDSVDNVCANIAHLYVIDLSKIPAV